MRVLVTGAAGFVAKYLVPELLEHGHVVDTTDVMPGVPQINYNAVDLCDPDAVGDLVAELRPDACVHLAGISFVPDGDRHPDRMLGINIGGTVNLLRAFNAVSPKARFLFVSTAQTYGCSVQPDPTPVTEETPLYPLSTYTISKCAGEQVVQAYGIYHDLCPLIARPANHTGPGQNTKFLVPSLVEQAKRIRRGELTAFTAGNMESGRDFSDVRDVVQAYRLILEGGRNGGIYNVSANQCLPLREIFAIVQQEAGIQAPIVVNPAFVRPTDFSRVLDTGKLRNELGWKPQYALRDTIRDMLRD